MEHDGGGLLQEHQMDTTDSPDLPYLPEDTKIIGYSTAETELSLSPVQIQQEYFENLSDCDWVK
jgi:hypothetical protein